MLNTQQLGHLKAFICVLVWGTTFVASKALMAYLTPLQLMLLRFCLAYVVLWIIHPKWYFKWREEWRFLLMALFANTLYYWAENTALTLTQASNVSILVSTSPIVAAVFLAVFYKEKLSRRQILGFAAAFIGVVLVVFNGAVTLHLNPLGDMLALLASVSWAAYGMLLRRWSGDYPSVLITRKLLFYAIITVLPLLISSGEAYDFAGFLTFGNIARLAYLVLLGNAMCFILWNSAVGTIGVLKSNMYIYMIPLLTLVASAIALGEQITFMGFGGIILVLAGMTFATIKKDSADKTEKVD